MAKLTSEELSESGRRAVNARWEQKRANGQWVMDYVKEEKWKEPKTLSRAEFAALSGDECIDINRGEDPHQWMSPCIDPRLAQALIKAPGK